jgi:putative DNA primase/helicase
MPGNNLAESDLRNLEASWITRELAEQALLRRVTSAEGAAIVGRNGNSEYAGILFPYLLPGQDQVREYRLRRDRPDLEYDASGQLKEKARYLSPPGRGNLLYFVPGTPAEWLGDTSIPVALTEGEKKTLALCRFAWHDSDSPRFMPVGLSGVWGWRGVIGKADGPNGGRCDVKGAIPDLNRINWAKRRVLIVFDVNVRTDDSVAAARVMLSKELAARGAEVSWVELPQVAGVNGVDDLLAAQGPDTVLPLFFDHVRPFVEIFKTTDYGNAERLTNRHGAEIRYCQPWKKWLCWNGKQWTPDDTGEVVRLAKATVRSIYREASEINEDEPRKVVVKWARESERADRIAAMIKLAQSEPGVPVLPKELDSDRWLLNCLNGSVDLHAGKLLPHRREHLITKLAPVEYDPAARCPRWLRFLDEIFEPHPDIVDFIQRAVGYSLTGDTREECLFLLWGTGRNGKGAFIKTVAAALGDYAGTADFSAFVQRHSVNGPRDDIANMMGKRFVSAQESREGAALAESLIKWLTGRDRIRARRLYENSYEFDPTHKIWLATNHKPIVRGTDPAIWSRLKLIPFEVSFEGREDKTLKQALLRELPGILAWALEGCRLWQKEGLSFPESVVNATSEYRRDSDQVRRFIEECCSVGQFAQVKARTLYGAYRKWAEQTGEEILSETAFGTRIGERFRKEHKETGTFYVGVSLKHEHLDYDSRVSSSDSFSRG